MIKPAFCITAQLNSAIVCTNSTIPLHPKSKILKPLVIFCGCTAIAKIVPDLVGNPEDRFFVVARLIYD